MKSVPATLFFKVMKEAPRIIPFLGIGNLIDAGRAPFLPGEKCYVREGWCEWYASGKRLADNITIHEAGVRYRSDGAEIIFRVNLPRYGGRMRDNGKIAWKSPVTMPAWAARRFVTILSCEPVRKEDGTWAWRVISQPSDISG